MFKLIVICTLIVAVLAYACYRAYRHAEISELHKLRACFEHYLEAHTELSEEFIKGIKTAEDLIDLEELSR